jgi:hypothetical protein
LLALLVRYLIDGNTDDACRTRPVNVVTAGEEVRECLVLRNVRSEPHLDLAVIGDDQGSACVRDDALPKFWSARQVLQVRVTAREAAGFCCGAAKEDRAARQV